MTFSSSFRPRVEHGVTDPESRSWIAFWLDTESGWRTQNQRTVKRTNKLRDYYSKI